jgi:hypothetical protein
MDNSKYITRLEIAQRTNMSVEAIKRSTHCGNIPGQTTQLGRFIYYEREPVEVWIEQLNSKGKPKQYSESKKKPLDIYGIRDKRKNFVYSGRTLMHILFCQPALRHGRHTYEDCK